MSKKAKYTIEELKDAVKTSTSIRQVLYKLQLRETGGNYSYLQIKLKKLCIDISHFTGQLWNKGKVDAKLLEQQLKKGTKVRAQDLKMKLLRTGRKKWSCENCKNSQWQGVQIPLELHHRNGDKTDNRIENLQILCPNCHAHTDNYRGRKSVETI